MRADALHNGRWDACWLCGGTPVVHPTMAQRWVLPVVPAQPLCSSAWAPFCFSCAPVFFALTRSQKVIYIYIFFFKSYIHLLECVCREKCPGELSVTHRGRKPHSQRCDRHCGISSCFLGWPQELLVVPAHSFPHHSVGILLQLPEGRAGCSVTACKGTTNNLSTRLSLPSVQM